MEARATAWELDARPPTRAAARPPERSPSHGRRRRKQHPRGRTEASAGELNSARPRKGATPNREPTEAERRDRWPSTAERPAANFEADSGTK